jgi:hypothetical protein
MEHRELSQAIQEMPFHGKTDDFRRLAHGWRISQFSRIRCATGGYGLFVFLAAAQSRMAIEIPPPNAPDSFFEELWQQCATVVRIARGSSRDVYAIPEHDDKVLKVMTLPSNAANWFEIVTYLAAVDKDHFAQVHSWSRSGKFLVMERLQPVPLKGLSLHAFPAFLNDRKPENFGLSPSGRIKVLDYAMIDLSSDPLYHFPTFS